MKASEPAGNGHSGATEDALRLAVDTTPAFIHTGRPDGYLDYFNRGWLDLIGKSLDQVCGWRWTESIHPDDVDGIVQKWRAALASGEPFEAEARVRCADGTYHALLHRKVSLHDCKRHWRADCSGWAHGKSALPSTVQITPHLRADHRDRPLLRPESESGVHGSVKRR